MVELLNLSISISISLNSFPDFGLILTVFLLTLETTISYGFISPTELLPKAPLKSPTTSIVKSSFSSLLQFVKMTTVLINVKRKSRFFIICKFKSVFKFL